MKLVLTTLMFMGALMFLAAPATADWDVGDPHKMHFPQMPDPDGWDVNFSQPKVLADDWLCTQTGAVRDVHFWMSSRKDLYFQLLYVHLSIHEDDIDSAEFSQPGKELWSGDFDGSMFTVRDYGTGEPQRHYGWYDPNTGESDPFDHEMYYQVNIPDIPDPFPQKQGTVYWLDISVMGIDPMEPEELGWKTSQDHFRDGAVWSDFGSAAGWQPLYDPLTGQTLDLAFVITPEPGTVMMLAFGGLALAVCAALRRRRRKA